jgi:hypothetical protein
MHSRAKPGSRWRSALATGQKTLMDARAGVIENLNAT